MPEAEDASALSNPATPALMHSRQALSCPPAALFKNRPHHRREALGFAEFTMARRSAGNSRSVMPWACSAVTAWRSRPTDRNHVAERLPLLGCPTAVELGCQPVIALQVLDLVFSRGAWQQILSR